MDDDDEEEQDKQPTKYEFSEESKLDEDHLFYLQFTNNFISNVTRPRDYDHCARWLERLAGEPMYGVEAKRNRNMFLAKLLIAMQDNKLKGPFSSFPPAGPLPNAAVAFGLTGPMDEEGGSMMFDEVDRELNMDNYSYLSGDGRTYIATCALPESRGVLAFVGLTFGGGEGLWLNKEGFQVPLEGDDRIPTITSETPIKTQVKMLKQHKERVRKGLDQEPPVMPDEAFMFLTDLPITSSDSNLLELGSYRFTKQHLESLLDTYDEQDELINHLQEFLIKSKKDIEVRLRARHDKLVKNMYKEYSAEIERGLREYKEARQEWANVYQVVAEMKEVLAEKDAKDAAANATSSSSGNRPTAVLMNSLNEAKLRQRHQYGIGQELDSKKVELHKEIHERALFHMHEVENLQAHVDRLANEICLLRRDSRKKQMVITSLTTQLSQQNQ